ncbi:MAG: alpha/beta fold hydrolase [Gemmatimonadota bacterium]
MPTLLVNGASLHYTDEGRGAETIVFAHGLLFSGRMFEAQVAARRDRYRCITFDFRGQGESEVTRSGYDMETLTADSTALIRALGAAPCHFVGLSMGGFIGMRLGFRAPGLLRSLTLIATSADPEPRENIPRYRLLTRIARWFGLGIVSGRVLPIVIGRTMLNDPGRLSLRREWIDRVVGNDKIGITRAVAGVIDRVGVYDEIAAIRVPTLVIVGEEDTATVPAKAERIGARIPGARLVRIPRAGHSATIEEPAAVTSAIGDFLASVT